jgi:hypothetical protein
LATSTQLASFRRRYPRIPTSVTDDVIDIYFDDAALELPLLNISTTDDIYDKVLSLYVMHLLAVNGYIKEISNSSVKDVSATFNTVALKPGETVYYREILSIIRRRNFPPYITVTT